MNIVPTDTYVFEESPLKITKDDSSLYTNAFINYVSHIGTLYRIRELQDNFDFYEVKILIIFDEQLSINCHILPALNSLEKTDQCDTVKKVKKYVENKIEEYKLISKEEFERLANSCESIKKYHL